MALVGCGHMSGLWMRHGGPLAQMGCADRAPNILTVSEHRWIPRVVSILGSTDCHLAALACKRQVGDGRA
jgi:hypothetical protein